MKRYVIIMAGGVGSRFWPLSRVNHPKQFLDILGMGKSLLQMTYERFEKLVPAEHIYIVANSAYRDMIAEQLPGVDTQQILSEPVAKNTAPCIAYASYKIHAKDPEAVVLVAPSDHLILNEAEFLRVAEQGFAFAETGDVMLTLGITPFRPDTGYGYIQYLEVEGEVKPVKTFTEKPSHDLAVEFIKSGDFLWNAGIFIWRTSTILDAFDEYLPETALLFEEATPHFYTAAEQAEIDRIYPVCSNISIDYAIIEKAQNVYVIPSEFGWSDLGTWKSLHEVAEKDACNSAHIGAHILSGDSAGNLVVSHGDKLVVVEGVNDLFVLDTVDALLVCHRDREQEVKAIVSRIKELFKGKYT